MRSRPWARLSAFAARKRARAHQHRRQSDAEHPLRSDAVAAGEPRAAMRRRTTGPGRCARPPTGRCCAGLKTGRWWWSPTAPAAPKLKARLMATGQEGTFGESGERFSPPWKTRRPTAASCWRAWILRPDTMPAWNRCWASARIWALPARCSRWLRSPFIRRSNSEGGDGRGGIG
jgi:hypothetical protein